MPKEVITALISADDRRVILEHAQKNDRTLAAEIRRAMRAYAERVRGAATHPSEAA